MMEEVEERDYVHMFNLDGIHVFNLSLTSQIMFNDMFFINQNVRRLSLFSLVQRAWIQLI